MLVLAGCSASSTVAVAPVTKKCTPAPIPFPQTALISPVPGSTAMQSPATVLVGVSSGYVVTALQISPAVDGSTALGAVSAVGTPSPNGLQTYGAAVPHTLAPGTFYSIAVDATFDPTGCPQTFVVTAGSFQTAAFPS